MFKVKKLNIEWESNLEHPGLESSTQSIELVLNKILKNQWDLKPGYPHLESSAPTATPQWT